MRRWKSADAVYIVAVELLKATAEKCGWTEHKVLAAFPGEQAGRRHLPASASGARFAGDSGRSRDAGAGHGRGAHGSGAWRGRFRSRDEVRDRRVLSGGWRGPLLPCRRRGRRAARSTDRQDRLAGQPDREGSAAGGRRAAGRREHRAQLSALLALPSTRPSSAPPSSGSSAWSATTCASGRSTRSSR